MSENTIIVEGWPYIISVEGGYQKDQLLISPRPDNEIWRDDVSYLVDIVDQFVSDTGPWPEQMPKLRITIEVLPNEGAA